MPTELSEFDMIQVDASGLQEAIVQLTHRLAAAEARCDCAEARCAALEHQAAQSEDKLPQLEQQLEQDREAQRARERAREETEHSRHQELVSVCEELRKRLGAEEVERGNLEVCLDEAMGRIEEPEDGEARRQIEAIEARLAVLEKEEEEENYEPVVQLEKEMKEQLRLADGRLERAARLLKQEIDLKVSGQAVQTAVNQADLRRIERESEAAHVYAQAAEMAGSSPIMMAGTPVTPSSGFFTGATSAITAAVPGASGSTGFFSGAKGSEGRDVAEVKAQCSSALKRIEELERGGCWAKFAAEERVTWLEEQAAASDRLVARLRHEFLRHGWTWAAQAISDKKLDEHLTPPAMSKRIDQLALEVRESREAQQQQWASTGDALEEALNQLDQSEKKIEQDLSAEASAQNAKLEELMSEFDGKTRALEETLQAEIQQVRATRAVFSSEEASQLKECLEWHKLSEPIVKLVSGHNEVAKDLQMKQRMLQDLQHGMKEIITQNSEGGPGLADVQSRVSAIERRLWLAHAFIY